ncbi:hypothetical protein chiPu_0033358, partial [Chiloscyllium punctatum]|nr:hypothetical protein [Chiloscyllium punctatum]
MEQCLGITQIADGFPGSVFGIAQDFRDWDMGQCLGITQIRVGFPGSGFGIVQSSRDQGLRLFSGMWIWECLGFLGLIFRMVFWNRDSGLPGIPRIGIAVDFW